MLTKQFAFKKQALPHNEERGTFTEDIPSQECQFTFKEISDSIKHFWNALGKPKTWALKVRRCWVAGYQWRQSIQTRDKYEGREFAQSIWRLDA